MAEELKEKFKMIIKEFHDTPLPDLVRREVIVDLNVLGSSVNKVVTIIGPRRAGKTFLLFQIMKELLRKKFEMLDILYINFEDERITPLKGEMLQAILDAYFELYPDRGKPLVFLDEIQNVPGWDSFVRRINDQRLQVFVTGSNSKMLGREIATSLRGRTLTYEVFPFSFKEFVQCHGVRIEPDLPYSKLRHKVAQLFEEYFFSGGYPEISLLEDRSLKGRILQDYFNTIFYRDLVERYAVKNTDLLRQWLNILIANLSSLISYSKVENDFKSRGMKLSRATLSYFAGYVEDAFFGFFIEMYSRSVRKRQVNPKKFYLVDVGLHNYLTFKFSENRGRILENLVFLELRRRTPEIHYYRSPSGQEVDFLVRDGEGLKLVQVCHDIHSVDVFTREKKSLLSAMEEFDIPLSWIITDHEKRKEAIDGRLIEIVPAMEWLLR